MPGLLVRCGTEPHHQGLAAEFMQLPRYLKVSTFFSAFPSMVMLGGGRAVFGASCLNTSVFLMLTVSPNDVAAVAKQSASSYKSTSE